MLRVVLFLLTNFAVLLVASFTLTLLGVDEILSQNGDLNLTSLLIFCGVMGMAGSFISLLISKKMAKWSTGAHVIDPKNPRNGTEAWLLREVEVLSHKAGIKMPEVAIFPSAQPNAFATGWNKNAALVAISSGMLQRFQEQDIKAVMGHEIAHVANGDMVTLTLIQGVVNTFVLFFARVIGHVVDKVVFKNREGYGIGYFLVVMIAQVVLGILASMIVYWFSRRREYAADLGGARLTTPEAMMSALVRLKKEAGIQSEMPESLQAFGISESKPQSFSLQQLFASHPPLDSRIEALRNLR